MASAPPPATPLVHLPPQYGAKVLIIGGTGNGKTFSLRTLQKLGIRVFIIFTENGMTTLRDTDPEWVDWHYIPPMTPDLKAMINMANKINELDRKQLAAYQDPYRSKHKQFVEVLSCLSNLKGDRTGKTYGPADKLDTGWALALDSLSGNSIMSLELVVGDQPVIDPGEWGMAMGRIEKEVQLLCFSTPCHVIVNAHEERETDEISQSTRVMVSVPGRKLAPKIPRFFDDVLYAYRKDKKWFWSTNYPGVADLKSRHLGIFESMEQDYGPVIEAWKRAQTAA